jgi:hypothetical protein
MIIASPNAFGDDRIRLIAIEMKGAFGNEGALPLSEIGIRDLAPKGKSLGVYECRLGRTLRLVFTSISLFLDDRQAQ